MTAFRSSVHRANYLPLQNQRELETVINICKNGDKKRVLKMR